MAADEDAADAEERVGLAEMFEAADLKVQRMRSENIFEQLNERALTSQEEDIIRRRVENQRKLLEEYEKRERARKVRELRAVAPELSERAALRALELCGGREDDAALRVTGDPTFRRRCAADAGGGASAVPRLVQAPAGAGVMPAAGERGWTLAKADQGAVFFGKFRSKMGPYQLHSVPAADVPAAIAAAPPQAAAAQPLGRPQTPAHDAGRASSRGAEEGSCPELVAGQEGHEAQQEQQPVESSDGPARKRARMEGGCRAACNGSSQHPAQQEPDGHTKQQERQPETCRPEQACPDGGGGTPALLPPASAPHRPQQQQQQQQQQQRQQQEPPPLHERAVASLARQLARLDVVSQLERLSELALTHPGAPQQLLAHLRGGLGRAELAAALETAWEVQQAAAVADAAEAAERAARAAACGGGDGRGGSTWSSGVACCRTAPLAPSEQQALSQHWQQQQTHVQEQDGAQQEGASAEVALLSLLVASTSSAEDAAEGTGTSWLCRHATIINRCREAPAGCPWGWRVPRRRRSECRRRRRLYGAPPVRASAAENVMRGGGSRGHGGHLAAATLHSADAAASQGGGSEQSGGDDSGSQQRQVLQANEQEGRGLEEQQREQQEQEEEQEQHMPGLEQQEEEKGAADAPAPAGLVEGQAAQQQEAEERQQEAEEQQHDVRRSGRSRKLTPAAASGMDAAVAARHLRTAAKATAAAGPIPPLAVGGGGGSGAAGSSAAAGAGRGSGGSSGSGGGGGGGSGIVLVTSRGAGGGTGGGARAVNPVTGHTCRGRVKQKSHKNTELVQLGSLMVGKGWYNSGYIFPAGFKSRLLFRSSIDLDALTPHECEIVGEGGAFWPAPTFVVTARDRPGEPMAARSCTGCWSGILKRIKGVIEARRAAGEDLPPAPKTAIAGPEYFGLNDAAVISAIEALDPKHLCDEYWAGKQQRDDAIAGAAPADRVPAARPPEAGGRAARGVGAAAGPAAGGGAGAAARGKRKGRRGGGGGRGAADAGDDGCEDDPEAAFRGNHWSALSRRDRYLARAAAAAAAGDHDGSAAAGAAAAADDDNPLPNHVDPITLEPVVAPAISPYGHVMGMATWRAVLSESRRCPFTKLGLRPEQLVALTKSNIDRYPRRDRAAVIWAA